MRNTLTFFAIIIFSVSINAQLQFVERSNSEVKKRNPRSTKERIPEPEGEENYVKLNNLGVGMGRDKGDFRSAIDYFKQAIEIEPNCFACRYNLGRSYIALKKYSDAQEIFDRLAKENPKSANVLSTLGEVFSLRGDDKKALPLLKKSLELDSGDSITLNNYGISLHNTGKYEEALGAFNKAIEIQPELVEAHNYRGLTLYQLGKYKKALKSLRLADSLQPNVPEIQNNLGVVLGKMGKKKEAHKHHLEAVRLNPNFSYAVYNLALNYLEIGKRDEAQKQLKSLEKIDTTLASSLRKVLWGKYVVDASAFRSNN